MKRVISISRAEKQC